MENAKDIISQNHALLAAHLDRWAENVDMPDNAQIFGFTDALRDVAAHLRKGDYAPGGNEWDEILGR